MGYILVLTGVNWYATTVFLMNELILLQLRVNNMYVILKPNFYTVFIPGLISFLVTVLVTVFDVHMFPELRKKHCAMGLLTITYRDTVFFICLNSKK